MTNEASSVNIRQLTAELENTQSELQNAMSEIQGMRARESEMEARQQEYMEAMRARERELEVRQQEQAEAMQAREEEMQMRLAHMEAMLSMNLPNASTCNPPILPPLKDIYGGNLVHDFPIACNHRLAQSWLIRVTPCQEEGEEDGKQTDRLIQASIIVHDGMDLCLVAWILWPDEESRYSPNLEKVVKKWLTSNSTLIPTSEILHFTSKLLSDFSD
ncbi:hypothetical protein Taro_017980 [Colocasia esculenta]|uniref:Uncharacterized protein n=1 Tax=Colocasia esculenta TaxID=4460 RepID=A0A843UPR5_COLES|nr:hypothetical protein [Colocasia esculenta]